MTTYFEDIEVGDVQKSEAVTVTEEEIIEFGEKFDPQSFHTDPEEAVESTFGGLIASGWHTVSLCYRLSLEQLTDAGWPAGIGKSVENLEWLEPVYAGDTIRVEYEVIEKSDAENRPSYGKIRTRMSGYNQHDERVITLQGEGLFERRPPDRE